ncbi:MAG: OsmC family protein [bacterium]|nr:OsmC family protein [bacterium]
MSVAIECFYEGELKCRARHDRSGSEVWTQAPADNGGKGMKFSPTDLMATALGTCMLTIMGLVAQRRGLDIRGTRVRVVKEMVSEPVRRIGALRIQIEVAGGERLSVEDRVRLERGALQCPVKHSLHPEVEVSVEWRWGNGKR